MNLEQKPVLKLYIYLQYLVVVVVVIIQFDSL